jgi:hypothetical protein
MAMTRERRGNDRLSKPINHDNHQGWAPAATFDRPDASGYSRFAVSPAHRAFRFSSGRFSGPRLTEQF